MTKRLESLDILRGMDMFMILCAGWSPLICLCEAVGLPDCWLVRQCHHAAWGAGVTIIDFVFPLFLFISGVTYPYSHAKDPSMAKVLRRVCVLFVLGLLYNHILAFDWATFTAWSVIGRIGIAWGVSALVYHRWGVRGLVGLVSVVSIGWWIAVRAVMGCGAHAWIGVPYSTVPMIATAALGMLAGSFLRKTALDGDRRAVALGGMGVVSLLAGGLISMLPFGVPVTKICWSTSFVFVSGGVSAILLAGLHWIVDVRGFARWGFFFKIIGVNPLTIYLLSWTVLRWEVEKEYFFGGLLRAFPGPIMNAGAEWGTLMLFWILLYGMYRKNIYLKV